MALQNLGYSNYGYGYQPTQSKPGMSAQDQGTQGGLTPPVRPFNLPIATSTLEQVFKEASPAQQQNYIGGTPPLTLSQADLTNYSKKSEETLGLMNAFVPLFKQILGEQEGTRLTNTFVKPLQDKVNAAKFLSTNFNKLDGFSANGTGAKDGKINFSTEVVPVAKAGDQDGSSISQADVNALNNQGQPSPYPGFPGNMLQNILKLLQELLAKLGNQPQPANGNAGNAGNTLTP